MSSSDTAPRPHALYRFWDAAGRLLYVGITLNPAQRWTAHRDDKPWWSDIASITLETYPDRRSVLEAERAAITNDKPLRNIQHNRSSSKTSRNIWTSEDMPDCCHDYCRDLTIYLPYLWDNGAGRYMCQAGHYWMCWWGHRESGQALHYRGRPWVEP